MSPESLGFAQTGEGRWRKEIRGRDIEFRDLRALDDLLLAEQLQREVMTLSEADLVHAPVLQEARGHGGFAIGAFDGEAVRSVAFGFAEADRSEAYLLSDFLAVVPDAQSLGIGFEMKRLQAALALERGFESIRWTVDPLRAANARLNFERLGALGTEYARNKYGSGFGADLYGGMPTDRLWLRWPLRTERTTERLVGEIVPRPDGSLDALEEVSVRSIGTPQLAISIPGHIDLLVKSDFDAAMRYRLQTREKIELALEAGYFVSGAARSGNESRLLMEPAAMFEETERHA